MGLVLLPPKQCQLSMGHGMGTTTVGIPVLLSAVARATNSSDNEMEENIPFGVSTVTLVILLYYRSGYKIPTIVGKDGSTSQRLHCNE